MNVKILKLKNQEEILCEVVKETDDGYEIKNPCVLLPTPNNTIAMSPWLPFTKTKEFTMNKELVMFVVEVIDEIDEQYKTQFSSVIAPKSKIVTPGGLAGPGGPVGRISGGK